MAIQQNTNIPEIRDTIVMLRKLSADDKVRQVAYYREKQQHDEASALGHARREGKAEGIAEGRAEERNLLVQMMHQKGYSEEQIKDLLGS